MNEYSTIPTGTHIMAVESKTNDIITNIMKKIMENYTNPLALNIGQIIEEKC